MAPRATDLALLRRIDAYLDAAPRTSARVETVGPFTLFVQAGAGWPFYARPTPGVTRFHARDVVRLRERQRELGVPESLEWVVELAPGLAEAAEAAGLAVHRHPLMHRVSDGGIPLPTPPGLRLRIAADADALAAAHAVAHVGFAQPGTDVGPAGDEVVARRLREVDPAFLTFSLDRAERGLTVTVLAELDGRPAATGAHNPLDGVTEIVGVATLPAFRRRGLAGVVTAALLADADEREVRDVVLSAADGPVARIYARLGFRAVAEAASAEPASPARA